MFGIPPFEKPGKGNGKEEGGVTDGVGRLRALGAAAVRTLNRSDVDLSARAVPPPPCCLHLTLHILLVWVRPCDAHPTPCCPQHNAHTARRQPRTDKPSHRIWLETNKRSRTRPLCTTLHTVQCFSCRRTRASHHEIEPTRKRDSCDIWRHDSCSHSDPSVQRPAAKKRFNTLSRLQFLRATEPLARLARPSRPPRPARPTRLAYSLPLTRSPTRPLDGSTARHLTRSAGLVTRSTRSIRSIR